jgi:hypothetical protein
MRESLGDPQARKLMLAGADVRPQQPLVANLQGRQQVSTTQSPRKAHRGSASLQGRNG